MSSNPFALLNDDSDDEEGGVPKPVAPKKVVETKPPKPPAAAPAAKTVQKKETAPVPAEKNDRPKTNGSSRPKENTPKNDSALEVDRAEKPSKRVGGFGKDGKDGKHRKTPGADLPGKTKKHEQDKKSGQAFDGSHKKGGRGPGGFGSAKQDAEDVEKGKDILEGAIDEHDDVVEGEGEGEGSGKRERRGKREEGPAPEPVPEEPPKMTYEEWQKSRTITYSNPELFKAVETKKVEADLSGLSVVDNELPDFLVLGAGNTTSKQGKTKQQRSAAKAQSATIDVGFQNAALEKPARESEGRGDRDRGDRRGGDRKSNGGGRGAGGGKSSGKGAAAIDINSHDLFPKL